MDIKQLKDNRWIGCSILEIVALPELNENSDAEKTKARHTAAFMQLINEFFYLTGGADSTMAEILWVTEAAEHQPFRSRIRLFVVLRCIGSSEQEVLRNLEHLTTVFSAFLKTQKYELAVMAGLESLLNVLPADGCTYAIVKREKCIANASSPIPYYYCDVISAENTDNFETLTALMSQQTNCCISFQLFPDCFTSKETYLLNETAANLDKLAAGLVSERQMVHDPSAKTPSKVYSYYSERVRAPLFKFNMLVYGDQSACTILAAKIASFLQSGHAQVTFSDFGCIDLSGERLQLRSMFLYYPWNVNNRLIYYYRNQKLLVSYPLAKALMRLPCLITADEAVAFFRVPLHVRGMAALKSNKGMPITEQLDETVTRKDNIWFGKLNSDDFDNVEIGCPPSTFTRHALIVGVPGYGKTTFAFHLLLQFYQKGIPFFAIEPTKTEYRGLIDAIPELQVFTPGNSGVVPFILNPFVPPKGISIEQYIPSLASAFKTAFSMPTPLDVIFLRAIGECYTKFGWKGYSKLGDPDVQVFGLYDFILVFKKLISDSTYSREVKGNLESGGVFRLISLIEQNSKIYDNINTISIEDLLKKPTVLELNAIENSEQKALIMALLLINICSYTKSNHLGDGKLKNAILLDEAHVLLGATKRQHDNTIPDAQGTTVQAIRDMIAEIRSYGTSIIIADQTPEQVGREIIAMTEVKVAFRLVQSLDKELIADTTNMDTSDVQRLSRLKTGEAFVYYGKLDSAQLLVTPDIRNRYGIRLVVPNDEIRERMTYWNDKKEVLKPYHECKLCVSCASGCDFTVRADAELYAKQLSGAVLPRIKDDADFLRYVTSMDKLLTKLVPDYPKERYVQLLSCVTIKFWRNVQLMSSFSISRDNLIRTIKRQQITVEEKEYRQQNTP